MNVNVAVAHETRKGTMKAKKKKKNWWGWEGVSGH